MGNGTDPAYGCRLSVLYRRRKYFRGKGGLEQSAQCVPGIFPTAVYRTGQFFPEFALNIGGGQNIYNFSYYGLFSPVVLIGYLLPNVKMSDYMMVASIVCLAAAVIILYRWLKAGNLQLR